MITRQLICTVLVALSCLAGTARAQDNNRRGPNVMPAPQQNENYSNNTNTYDRGNAQALRGPNTIQAQESSAQARLTPRTERAPVDNTTQARPEAAERSGPNIVGEPAGLSAPEDDRSGRRGVTVPGCERCVAI